VCSSGCFLDDRRGWSEDNRVCVCDVYDSPLLLSDFGFFFCEIRAGCRVTWECGYHLHGIICTGATG
jgi:hypothetical protein